MSNSPVAEGDPSEREPFLPDEVWEQFEQDSLARIRQDAPKEPSARARMVAERLRREDELATQAQKRRLGRRKKRVQARPEGWRSWQGGSSRGNRDWVATTVILTVLVGVLVLAFYPWGPSY
ncbi:hypothetical protein [Streptomyces sp. NPDC051561]|uniref:hypothetical protein n=1 Tax=Streptomyces sp. NPDC051561 TaxID=3365658 RepID=UPI0037A13686